MLIKWFKNKIKKELKNEIIENELRKMIADTLLFILDDQNNSNKIKERYYSCYEESELNSILRAIHDVFSDIARHIYLEKDFGALNEKIKKFDEKINAEKYIDEIIERINRKQLK